MKKYKSLIIALVALIISHQLSARKITFSVDMSGQSISPNGVRVAGNFRDVNYDAIIENPGQLNNWDTTANAMSNGGSGAIYSITLDLIDNIVYEFKFINGNSWINVENVPLISQVNNTGNTNRWSFIPLGTDTFKLPVFRFSGAAPVGKKAILASVDGRNTNQTAQLFIAGSFNGFNELRITNYIGSGVFSGTIYKTLVYPDSGVLANYKFLNGPGGWEDIPLACGNGGVFNDRTLLADIDKVLPLVCFNACTSCSYPIQPADTAQFVNQTKLTANPINDSADYISPVFKNSTYRDTLSVSGIVLVSPRVYGLSTARKALCIQRPGGGPWSGIQIMCEPNGSGTTLANLLNETSFYTKGARGNYIRATGVIRAFANETQINLIRNNGADSSIKTLVGSATPVYTTIPINQVCLGGLKAAVPAIQKATGEQWEGVLVQFNNVIVDTIIPSGSRFFWKVRDANNNAIGVSDFSGFFRNDNNEDSAIANTYAPPAQGTRLQYIRGILREVSVSGIPQYQIAPLYPEDVGPVEQYPYLTIDSVQFVNSNKLNQIPVNDVPDYISPVFVNNTFADTISTTGIVVMNPRIYGLSTNRKATFLQRPGGGPWSGVQLLCEPVGLPGFSISTLLNNTQFYQKAQVGNIVRANTVIRAFANETQLNILPNGADSSLKAQGTGQLVYTPITLNQLVTGGLNNTNGVQQKVTGEKWEGVLVTIPNVTVDTIIQISATRFQWKVRDDFGNAIGISDFSGFFRNDNNEDSAIANTYAPPAKGTRLFYIRGVVREVLISSVQQYQISPLYPNDVGPVNPVPVKFTYLNVADAKNHLRISWHTATEINNHYFEVERSTNNEDFTRIGLVKGKGNVAVLQQYFFDDPYGKQLLDQGQSVYYRLKQVDYDGAFEYSPISGISPSIETPFACYPNPAQQLIKITGLTETAVITNVVGVPIMQISTDGEVNISGLNAGMYFIHHAGQSIKLIKQ
ncbi:MAG: T9SS C-terminal target domain-containing protein [Bacteroidetes bacterium]|nr:MAG: T9SS C-terminal target domain-containing protein [Bacteroidota bacterium]